MSGPKKFPFHELKASFTAQRAEILAAVERCLDGGWYILGPEVKKFEEEFARFTETKFTIGVGSATEALQIGLSALGVRHGDDVVCPALTAAPTAMAIVAAGGRPVFADIDPETFVIDPKHLERVLTPETKAVIAVDLYGQCADYDAIEKVCAPRGISIFEDASQSHGARDKNRAAGGFGRLAAFSFYPTKNLGAFGDGGCLNTNDQALADECRRLRNYGFIEGYDCERPGINARLDEIHAAMLRVKLTALSRTNAERVVHARRYFNEISNPAVKLPKVRAGAEHVWHQFVVRVANRDAFRRHLADCGIETLVHYPRAISEMKVYRPTVDPALRPIEAVRAAAEICSLPIYPEMSVEHQDAAIEAVNSYRA